MDQQKARCKKGFMKNPLDKYCYTWSDDILKKIHKKQNQKKLKNQNHKKEKKIRKRKLKKITDVILKMLKKKSITKKSCN